MLDMFMKIINDFSTMLYSIQDNDSKSNQACLSSNFRSLENSFMEIAWSYQKYTYPYDRNL